MNVLTLKIKCPGCGSEDVVYSCEPQCCFNHVCSECLNAFQLTTRDSGDSLRELSATYRERESLAPTVACARCEGLNVVSLESDTAVVCLDCHALLELCISTE